VTASATIQTRWSILHCPSCLEETQEEAQEEAVAVVTATTMDAERVLDQQVLLISAPSLARTASVHHHAPARPDQAQA